MKNISSLLNFNYSKADRILGTAIIIGLLAAIVAKLYWPEPECYVGMGKATQARQALICNQN